MLSINFESSIKISCILANAACLASSKRDALILLVQIWTKFFFSCGSSKTFLFKKINELQQ